jgi:putative heme-binding domain-containing protein
LVLAKRAQPEDRTRLVESLASPQASVIEAAAESLANSDSSASVDEIAIAVGALRQSCGSPEPRKVRKALADLLAHWTNEQFAIDDNKRTDARIAYEPWFAWFAAAHPDAAKKQASASTIDLAALKARLAGVQWDQGDVARGRIVFEKRACQRCHIGGGKLGPSLGGAVSRFSADDLFTAIADPNKDVAPLYQTTQVVTRSGQVHTGLLVYDSAEQVLVQIGPDTTVRIEGADVASKQPSRQSIMPSGLLNGLTDDDLADLRAFLKTLGQE